MNLSLQRSMCATVGSVEIEPGMKIIYEDLELVAEHLQKFQVRCLKERTESWLNRNREGFSILLLCHFLK